MRKALPILIAALLSGAALADISRRCGPARALTRLSGRAGGQRRHREAGQARGCSLRLQVEDGAPLLRHARSHPPLRASLTHRVSVAADGVHVARRHGRHGRRAVRGLRLACTLHMHLLTPPASPASYGFDLGTKAGTPGGPFIEGMNLGVEGMLVRVSSVRAFMHALCPHWRLHSCGCAGGRPAQDHRCAAGAAAACLLRLLTRRVCGARSAAGAGIWQAAGARDPAGASLRACRCRCCVADAVMGPERDADVRHRATEHQEGQRFRQGDLLNRRALES